MTATPDGDGSPVMITRDDLTAEIRDQGKCSCPLPRVDLKCPRHGAQGTELPGVSRVERLSLRDGDALVITIPAKLSMAQADRLRSTVREELGISAPVVILDDGAQLQVAEGGALTMAGHAHPGGIVAYRIGDTEYAPDDVTVVRAVPMRRRLPPMLRFLAAQLRDGAARESLAVTLVMEAHRIAHLSYRVHLDTGGTELAREGRAPLVAGLTMVARRIRDGEDRGALASLLWLMAAEYESQGRAEWPT